jgi:copper resistance protein C
MRGPRALLAVGALVAGLLALSAGPALAAPGARPGPVLAHNVLVSSDPAEGSSLDTGPARATLRFDLPVQPSFDTVTVVGPDGGTYQDGKAVVDGNTVSVAVRPLGPAGAYTVGYRVVSDDGHPVSGKVSFTLTRAGTGTPGPPAAAEQSDAGSGSGGSDGGGMPAWPWIIGAVVLVGAGAAVALRAGKG